jgi:hypothetical protein
LIIWECETQDETLLSNRMRKFLLRGKKRR